MTGSVRGSQMLDLRPSLSGPTSTSEEWGVRWHRESAGASSKFSPSSLLLRRRSREANATLSASTRLQHQTETPGGGQRFYAFQLFEDAKTQGPHAKALRTSPAVQYTVSRRGSCVTPSTKPGTRNFNYIRRHFADAGSTTIANGGRAS